jgi:hypothetical protein
MLDALVPGTKEHAVCKGQQGVSQLFKHKREDGPADGAARALIQTVNDRILQAVLAAPWGADRDRWSPVEDASNSHLTHTTAAVIKQELRTGERAVCALTAVTKTNASAELIPWILQHTPKGVDSVRLALALCHAPPSILRADSVGTVIGQRDDGVLLGAMVGYAASGCKWTSKLGEGLGMWDKVSMAKFVGSLHLKGPL